MNSNLKLAEHFTLNSTRLKRDKNTKATSRSPNVFIHYHYPCSTAIGDKSKQAHEKEYELPAIFFGEKRQSIIIIPSIQNAM